jgi:hypothetical protein
MNHWDKILVLASDRKGWDARQRSPGGFRGWSRTDFVREAAVRAAEEMLMQSVLLRMNPAASP